MGNGSFSITQGSYFLSEEIHVAKLSLIMIIDYYRKQHRRELGVEDGIADYHMVLEFDQEVLKFRRLYFGC